MGGGVLLLKKYVEDLYVYFCADLYANVYAGGRAIIQVGVEGSFIGADCGN